MTDTVGAVVVAAGSGTRMAGADKPFTEVAGRPLLAYAIGAFQDCAAIDRIVLVLSEQNLERGRDLVRGLGCTKVAAVVPGGERRQDSVRLGLEALGECDYVAVHDGARPLVTPDLIERGIDAARETGAAVPAIPLADTVKEAGPDGIVLRTLDRSRLWAVQTPQVFSYELLLRAHREGTADVTDDAAMVEALGERVRLFEGDRRNLKVTTTADLHYVRWVPSNVRLEQKIDHAQRESVQECPFCDYEDAGSVVYEDDQVFAVVDRQPINDYHMLVIPKEHHSDFVAMPDDLTARVLLIAKKLSSALREVARPDAITHLSDDDVSRSGFNQIEHFKIHLIPRYKGDAVRIDWNRSPPPNPAARAKAANEIRNVLSRA